MAVFATDIIVDNDAGNFLNKVVGFYVYATPFKCSARYRDSSSLWWRVSPDGYRQRARVAANITKDHYDLILIRKEVEKLKGSSPKLIKASGYIRGLVNKAVPVPNGHIAIYNAIYKALQEQYGINVNDLLIEQRKHMLEAGVSVSKILKLGKVDAIEEIIKTDSRLLQCVTTIVKDIAKKYNIVS